MASELLTLLAPLEAVCADPYKAAREAAANGQKVAGFVCSYAPQEMFHAAGYFPVRILGRQGGTPHADELLQSYSCSFARSLLDAALAGEYDFLDLVVFSHTCDTVQNVADLWKANCPQMPVLIVTGPVRTTGTAAHVYYCKELERVRECIGAVAGPVSIPAIGESFRLYQQHRHLMRRLYAIRRAYPERLTASQMMTVVRASFFMRREDHIEILAEIIETLDAMPIGKPVRAPRVLVAGSVCQDNGFVAALEEAGCMVADDDLCMGSRSFLLPDVPDGDPIEALAEVYLARPPCPAFHKPGFDPAKHLVDRVHEAHADGVVFLLTKFCDPWAFDYPHIRETLAAQDIPALLLEVEQNLPAPEQYRTRAEAFAEMLQARAAR